MDYAAGGSLGNLVSTRGELRIGEAVTILTPIAQALDYLHTNGVEHGDVSPGNVVMTAEGMPLLADLGLAARVGEQPRGHGLGTPGFMEPSEEASGNAEELRASLQPHRDVYSLGALGWYCLTGTPPAPEQNRPPLSLLVPEVPKVLAAALEAALDRDVRKRPSAKEFGMAIFRSAAAESLDLSGAVHASVIPELLTRRQSMGRPAGGFRHWLRTWRWSLPRMSGMRRPATSRSLHRRGRSGTRPGRTTGTVAALAVLIAMASWVALQGNTLTTAAVQPVGSGTGVAVPTAAGSLPHALESPAVDILPPALSEGLQSQDPLIALAALSAVRDIALGEGRLELLGQVNAPGSQAEVNDQQLRDYLDSAGSVFAGFQTTLTDVAFDGIPQDDRLLVSVTASASGYEERLASGGTVRNQAAGPPQQLRLELLRWEGRWRISAILGAAPA